MAPRSDRGIEDLLLPAIVRHSLPTGLLIEVAQLAGRAKPEGDDFELDGSSNSCILTFYGDDVGPMISLRQIHDEQRRKAVGWELVSSQPFSCGLNVTDVGRAPLH